MSLVKSNHILQTSKAHLESQLNSDCMQTCMHTYTFIHSGYFYSTSSCRLLFRGSPDTAQILCQSFMLKRHRQLQVKDLLKVPTWWLEWDSNPRPFGRKATNLPMSHYAPQSTSMCVFMDGGYRFNPLSPPDKCITVNNA